MWKSWEKWAHWESWEITLQGDTIEKASLVSASFTSDTILKLTTDTTLDTNLSIHSWSLITYTYQWTTYTWTSIDSVDWQSINITIPPLLNLSATWTDITIHTWALRSNAWGYNDYITSSITIQDKQNPIITNFTKDISAWFSNNWNNYYSWSIQFSWGFQEQMAGWWDTYFQFTRTSWNSDSSLNKANLVDSPNLSSWVHNKSIVLSWSSDEAVSLTCGTQYKVYLAGQDLAWNTVQTSDITNIWYDACAPEQVVLNQEDTFWSSDITLTWNQADDDNWNGSWIKEYNLLFYNGTWCSSLNSTYNVWTTSQAINWLANGSYSWKVQAVDNMVNIWDYSSCDDFVVDDTVPTISNAQIKDTTLDSTTYTTSWSNIEVSANISNTNSSHIWLDMTTLAGVSYPSVNCSNPQDVNITCNYTEGTVTYFFPVWFSGFVSQWTRQVNFTAQNTVWANEQTKIASITYDDIAPSVDPTTITFPNGGETLWWEQDITWDDSLIIDDNFDYIELSYSSDNGSNWTKLYTWWKVWPYTWDTTSLTWWTDYLVKITAYDKVWLTWSDMSDAIFSIDASAPSISWDLFTYPTDGDLFAGWESINITWNTWDITDDITTWTDFDLDFYYSSDNGTNWSLISTWHINDWSLSWTIPTIDTTSWKLKAIVHDEAWNKEEKIWNFNFSIDSTKPSLSITYSTAWWSTPPDGNAINDNGFDISAFATDANLSWVYYRFENITDSTFYNLSTFTWTETWNLFCTADCWNTLTWINANIEDWKQYKLTLKAIDTVWNEILSSQTPVYDWDNTNPNITSLVNSWSYFSWTANIYWTGYDNLDIQSVLLQIKKWTDYYDGSSFVWTETTLSTSTTDDFANWNYDFTMPEWDSEWQAYDITYIIEDSSYKVANSNSWYITIYKDTEWPVIDTNNFWTAPTWWTILNGGTNYTITWDKTNITDNLAWLWTTPIKVEYWTWAWHVITWATENDGSFDWTLPTIDNDSVKLRITAKDNIWNESFIESENFTIDSNPPSINTIETMDKDANWQIDALSITFSEKIKYSSVDIWDFTINWWITIDSSNSIDDYTIELIFANTGDTSTIPTLDYTQGGLEDLAWNKLETISNVASIDKAVPRILTWAIFDADSNWKFDEIKLTFSEYLNWNITDTTVFTINNALAWISIASVSTTNNIATIILNEQDNIQTNVWNMTLSFNSNANWKDANNNQAWAPVWGNPITLEDKANPIITSALLKDEDSDYTADNIELTFSENLTWSLSWFTTSSWSISNTLKNIAYYKQTKKSSYRTKALSSLQDFTTSEKELKNYYSTRYKVIDGFVYPKDDKLTQAFKLFKGMIFDQKIDKLFENEQLTQEQYNNIVDSYNTMVELIVIFKENKTSELRSKILKIFNNEIYPYYTMKIVEKTQVEEFTKEETSPAFERNMYIWLSWDDVRKLQQYLIQKWYWTNTVGATWYFWNVTLTYLNQYLQAEHQTSIDSNIVSKDILNTYIK